MNACFVWQNDLLSIIQAKQCLCLDALELQSVNTCSKMSLIIFSFPNRDCVGNDTRQNDEKE